MKNLSRRLLTTAPVALLLILGVVVTARAQTAKLQLDQLDFLVNRANSTVDVKLDERLLQATIRIFDKDDQDIKEILKGLKGIYVKSFSFEKENQYLPSEVESVTSQLRSGGWNKIVGITSKKEGENVEVYLMSLGDQISGLAVVCANAKDYTVVNIVGPISLEKLSQLEGSFGVPDLDLAKPKAKKDNEN